MNFRLVAMSQKFPFINEMSEIKNIYFDSTKALRRLPQKSPFGRLYFNELDRYILGDMCIDSPNNTWNFDDVTVVKCRHKSWSDRYMVFQCLQFWICKSLHHNQVHLVWACPRHGAIRKATTRGVEDDHSLDDTAEANLETCGVNCRGH